MSDPNPTPNPEPNPTPNPTPDDDIVERWKREAQKNKELADSLQAKLAEENDKKLREKQNYKELADIKEKEAGEWKQKFTGLNAALIQERKLSVVTTEALKQGIINTEDLELVDFPEVTVETTSTGKIIVQGAELAVRNLKAKRPNWFKAQAPTVNPDSPEIRNNGSGGNTSLESLMKLEEAYRKNPRDAEARRKYQEALVSYKTQKS